ncbi:MAG TPA: ACP S-malonyltransferase [Acidimicrobiales bacterium]|jgi:[acyl-carrier-protein] S-malonyltransferase|nr:ACP S-malonyltransferase [Acidimicrobiales bacterium]
MTIAFTFPGQGSQKPGMGRPWVDHESWELVLEASDAAGRDLGHLLLEADAAELTLTRNAQLATYVLSLVTLDAVERLGVEPAVAAGHSLGEYSALTAAGALDFGDGVKLVAERGEAMQIAADERTGSMAAVLGLDDDKVEIACMRAAADVWAANFNAPGNVVIAGDPDAIVSAGTIAKDLGASKVLPVKVSGAFHTPFMAPARDRLRKALAEVELRPLDIPVVANVDATTHDDLDVWPGLLTAQLCSPVRWRQTLHALADQGIKTFVELGPGTVLGGTIKRTLDGVRSLAVNTPDDLDTLLERIEGEAAAAHHEGEHLFMTERVVVSPAAGLFEPVADLDAGRPIEAGELLGTVGEAEVRSPFSGRIEGVLAHLGERVMSRQPIAWLRTA